MCHNLAILRDPNAFALVSKFKCDGLDAEQACNLIRHAHLQDGAIGHDEHIWALGLQPIVKGYCCDAVALHAQLEKRRTGVSLFHLQGVLRVIIRNLAHDLLELLGQLVPGLQALYERSELEDCGGGCKNLLGVEVLPAQVKARDGLIPLRIRQVCQFDLVPLAS